MSRKKIMVLSDHPLVPSGVGIQTKYLIEGLLKTGKYEFVCLGGAIKHPDMRPQMVAPEEFGDGAWRIFPVNGHGDKPTLRMLLDAERPDAVLMVTDPRFFVWVWEMEDEVRSVCPLTYWHVWDNEPSPEFNKPFYWSTDAIGCISLKTFGLLQDLKYPKERYSYIPHALPPDDFKPLTDDEIYDFRAKSYGPHADKKFIVMWNNRNARRKQTGDVIASFAKFARKVGKKNVALFMHTSPTDSEGQNVHAVAKKFDIAEELIISEQRVDPGMLNKFYNVADVTLNISSAEGFGLSTLESLYAGTPIVVHMTGGLQFQLGPWWKDLKDFSNQEKMYDVARKAYAGERDSFFGAPVFPGARTCTGSQQIPYIYSDYVSHDSVVDALERMYNMGRNKRKALGLRAREWALKEFDMGSMVSGWDELLTRAIDNYDRGSAIRTAII